MAAARRQALMTPTLDDPLLSRQGSADWLSLALIDARNCTLRWLTRLESAQGLDALAKAGRPPPGWQAGHIAWWQEWWIGRNTQAQRGEGCDAARPRLASIDPGADALYDPARLSAGQSWRLALPEGEALRQYLAVTLESTLDLLASAGPGDPALYFYRLALWREDRLAERLAEAAQALQLPAHEGPLGAPARAEREPLCWPAGPATLGAARGGLVPAGERWAHEIAVPEFEIDAQALSWGRFVEFADDGGYIDRRHWSDAGWAWVQRRRAGAPQYVQRLRPEVVVEVQGRPLRAAAQQPAVHLTRHEAEAWCRWAGRRLPTEVEWETAARHGAARGFVWGDVLEWTGGRARAWPG